MSTIKPIEGKPSFKDIVSQLLILAGVTLTSMFIFSFIGLGLGVLFFDVNIQDFSSFEDLNISGGVVDALKIYQVFSAIGTFLAPAIIVPLILKARPQGFLTMNNNAGLPIYMLVTLLLFFLFPFIEWLIKLNQNLDLPQALNFAEEWMQEKQGELKQLMDAFMEMEGWGDFIANVFVVAILAALAEELFFRGLLQRLFYQWFGKVHLAIVITAILFSAFHMQFYGFIPRMFLGLLFGYLLYWTGTIWVPVFAHFLNNFIGVLVAFLSQKGVMTYNSEQAMDYPSFTIIVSLFLAAIAVFYLRKLSKRKGEKEEQQEEWIKVYTTTDPYKSQIVQGVLESEGIQNVKIDKKDSSYQVFGEIEIYVNPGNAERAQEIILNREL